MPSNSASDKWSWHAVGAIVLPAIVLAGCGSMEPPTGESNPPSESSKALLPTATTVESDAEAFEHEAGEVVSGEVLSHKFTYTNRRSVPIFIESQSAISHSCSCTMLDVEPWRLLPGESAQVAMEVRTRGKSGAVEETATVRWSGDPAGDWSSEFTLKASAAVLASATPAAVYMQSATPGQPLPRPEVVVRSKPPWTGRG